MQSKYGHLAQFMNGCRRYANTSHALQDYRRIASYKTNDPLFGNYKIVNTQLSILRFISHLRHHQEGITPKWDENNQPERRRFVKMTNYEFISFAFVEKIFLGRQLVQDAVSFAHPFLKIFHR